MIKRRSFVQSTKKGTEKVILCETLRPSRNRRSTKLQEHQGHRGNPLIWREATTSKKRSTKKARTEEQEQHERKEELLKVSCRATRKGHEEEYQGRDQARNKSTEEEQ
jgi:hypothetical protein